MAEMFTLDDLDDSLPSNPHHTPGPVNLPVRDENEDDDDDGNSADEYKTPNDVRTTFQA